MEFEFSYKNYIAQLSPFKDRVVDYRNALDKDSFVVVRHDVEFSVERAVKMAQVDSVIEIPSSFLFQVKSDAYNICSNETLQAIRDIDKYGGKVGLHFYVTHIPIGDFDALKAELQTQCELFENAVGLECDRFSFHRPPRWVLDIRDDYILGKLNLYGPSFFELADRPTEIIYLADSLHRFKYGLPAEHVETKKLQLLFHPDEWSQNGESESANFRSLEAEHLERFKITLARETPANYCREDSM